MNLLSPAWRSLRTRFFILMLAGFLLVAGGAYISFNWVLADIVQRLGTLFAEKQVLYDRERSLRPILREVTLARKLTTSPTILAWAADEEEPAVKARGLRELENFRQAFADKSYFFAVRSSGHYYFNDAQGQYTGKELRYTLHESNPENRWFFDTMRQPAPCLLNVDHDAKINVTKLWINCVVRRGNEPLGIIGTGIDLTTFVRTVIESAPDGIVNIFVDQSGAIQAHRDPKLIDFRSISKKVEERKRIFDLVDTEPEREQLRETLAALKSGSEPVRTLFLGIGGQRFLAGLAYIPEFGWYNVTLMGIGSWVRKEYFTPIVVLFAVALTGFLVLSGLLFKILVLDRVSHLDQSVRRIAQGDYAIELRDDHADEIGRLTSQFRIMAQQVRETTQNLESRVAQRTAELADANATKDKFLNIIAHDLRGPIGTVRNLARELKPGDVPDPELVLSTRNSAEYAYAMLENLLFWASSQTGHRKPDPVTFALYPELVLTISGLRAMAAEKSISIVTKIPEDLKIVGDVEMTRVIIRNLVSNAIKFSQDKSEIRVVAEATDTYVRIAVQDHGVGITPEAVAHLFRIGERNISTPGTHKERGTGLGLILCKELATKNGGDIEVDSTPGKGSTFTLKLPVARTA
jgi:signal transduction histidine kinase